MSTPNNEQVPAFEQYYPTDVDDFGSPKIGLSPSGELSAELASLELSARAVASERSRVKLAREAAGEPVIDAEPVTKELQ